MIQGFREFEFDLPKALLSHLISTFDSMETGPLAPVGVMMLPEQQGVYQLLHEGEVVYVGKTDAEAGLRQRLSRHAWTVQHRCGLDVGSVMFRALRVFVFTAVDLETQLIRHYGGESKVSWNNSGFGSNDPGRRRDKTELKAGGFDARFPIDLDRAISLGKIDEPATAAQLLGALRSAVPYGIRSEGDGSKKRGPHPDLLVRVGSQASATTAREVITNVVAALRPGWQATLLPGRVILYREHEVYSAGSMIARS